MTDCVLVHFLLLYKILKPKYSLRRVSLLWLIKLRSTTFAFPRPLVRSSWCNSTGKRVEEKVEIFPKSRAALFQPALQSLILSQGATLTTHEIEAPMIQWTLNYPTTQQCYFEHQASTWEAVGHKHVQAIEDVDKRAKFRFGTGEIHHWESDSSREVHSLWKGTKQMETVISMSLRQNSGWYM